MKKPFFAVALLAVVVGSTAPARAQSNDECAIWLCAPVGFVLPGCGGPLKAMIKRTATFKSPAPSFRSCEAEESGVSMSQRSGIAAVMALEKRACVAPGPLASEEDCEVWEVTVPGTYIEGTRCIETEFFNLPEGCITTYRYIQVYQNGQPYGDTYYYPQ